MAWLSRWRRQNKKSSRPGDRPRRLHQGKKNRRSQRLATCLAGDSVDFFGSLPHSAVRRRIVSLYLQLISRIFRAALKANIRKERLAADLRDERRLRTTPSKHRGKEEGEIFQVLIWRQSNGSRSPTRDDLFDRVQPTIFCNRTYICCLQYACPTLSRKRSRLKSFCFDRN